MNIAKILTLIGAGLVAFALFGLTFSASLPDDGILLAVSVGLLAGIAGFLGTALIVRVFSDMERKMSSLKISWAGLFGLGVILVAIDAVSKTLIAIKGVPALGVIGAALILLVTTVILNWQFKTTWDERSKSNGR